MYNCNGLGEKDRKQRYFKGDYQMQKFNTVAKKAQVLGNKVAVTKLKALVTGDAAAALVDKLVYGTKLANDHILHELEARYGAVMAQYLMERMPK